MAHLGLVGGHKTTRWPRGGLRLVFFNAAFHGREKLRHYTRLLFFFQHPVLSVGNKHHQNADFRYELAFRSCC